MFLLKALVLVQCVGWHFSGCVGAPCYDYISKEARPCFPQPVNAATGRNVTASNTCGTPSASYCEISPEKKCLICNASSTVNMHPAEHMVDEESPLAPQPTWWQSDTWWDAIQSGISKIGEPLHVNITLTFGKSYHISGKVRVTFYSERPQAMVIERSSDGGVTWNVFQYFAKDCDATYGMSPSESPSAENPLEVTCSEEYSLQFPAKNGIVEFQAFARYSPADYMAPHIQSYLLASHVRLRLEYPGTDGLELINSEVTLNRYYYAISDIRIDGRCNCNGHAEYCDGVGMNQYCFCEHNTMGQDCEYCRPLYNNQPWRPANTTHANECQKCNCNEHASSCTYDADIKSGVCIDCNHNTTGVQCHECDDGFYRDVGKALNDSQVCIPCDCFSVGITDNGNCNKNLSRADIILGQCNCKDNVFGRQCDECVPGYWGFRLPPGGHCQACSCDALGAMNNSQICDQQTGNCFCKPNIEGEKCNECKNGFYHFPTEEESDCLKCPCDVGGAYEICQKQTGQCSCRPNIEGQYCTRPKPGFFIPPFDYLLFEAEFQDEYEDIQYEEQSQHTGQGFAILTPDTTIQFKNVEVEVTWRYYLVIRYANNPQYPDTAFTITLEDNDVITTLSSSENRLQVDAKSVATMETFSLVANQLYNINVSFSSSASDSRDNLLVDSLVLKPDLAPTRIGEKLGTLLSRCFINATYLSSTGSTNSVCSEMVFSFSAEMYDGALACDCEPKGSREVSQCSPIGGQCNCYTGVGGRQCSYCLPGYHGFGHGACKVCECDSDGAKSDVCDIASGLCQCKVNTENERCSKCKLGTFNLDSGNEQGCQSCFGYGHGTQCTSAQGFVAANITTDFTGSNLGGWLRTPNSADAMSTVGTDGLLIHGNLTLTAPPKYLGLHLNSYKQKLLLMKSSSVNFSPQDVLLLLAGQEYNVQVRPDISVSDNYSVVTFTLDENHLVAGEMTAFQFQSLLSNISSFKLRFRSESIVISGIVLQSAVYDASSIPQDQISFVENVTCFENYTGLSCEVCAAGFTREIATSGPFAKCVLCSCNGRSSQCDPESGVCIGCDIGSTGDYCENCEFNVVGPYCNVCADGFYGLTQDHKNCKPCDCHLAGTQYGNTSSCNVTTGQCKCNQTLNTGGRRCNVCQENAWNRTDSSLNCEECPPCFGMIKVEVDKFRHEIRSLMNLFQSLLQMDILSQTVSFTKRLQSIQDRVEEIGVRTQALAAEEESAKLQQERAFRLLETMETSVSTEASEVGVTVNGTNKIIQERDETVLIIASTRDLITHSYLLLNNTMESLLNDIRTSLELLDDWVEELREINFQSLEKVREIDLINNTIDNHLETAQSLITKAMADASNSVILLNALVLRIPSLQANTSDAKEAGKSAYETARQRYNNASIVFNVTSHLDVGQPNRTRSIAKDAIRLKELAQKVRGNATEITEAVHNALAELRDVMGQINVSLKQITVLQEQVHSYQQEANEHRDESLRYHTQGINAQRQAHEIHEHAKSILDAVENYGVAAQKAEQESQTSIKDASELTTFHQSRIDYAKSVAQSLHSSYNSSSSLVALAEKTENHAREENNAISKTFALSEKLRNYTADEKAATVVRNYNMVLDHIENQVNPLHEKCAKIRRDTQDVLENTTTTQKAAEDTLEKVQGVSKQLGETSTSYEALPTLNPKPLSAMVADITRIRDAFEALKLSTSLQKLRQGKDDQQKWLDEHKPRVLKLRRQVAEMTSLIESLKDISCQN